MSDFLKLLPLELQMLDKDKLAGPIEPMKPNEKQIGLITDETQRKLWSMYLEMRKSAEQAFLEARYQGNLDMGQELGARGLELYVKSGIIESIFWALIRDDFKHWNNDNIGVRAGWILVEFPEPPHGIPFFRMMGEQ